MLKFEHIKILCPCENEINLKDSDFHPLEDYSPFSIQPEFKTASIKCSKCGKEGTITICWKHIARHDGVNDVLSPSDLTITNDFHIIESNIDISNDSTFGTTSLNTQSFINDNLEKIYNEFFLESQQKNFYLNNKCALNFTFEQDAHNNIDYSRRDVQQLYLLYYFYAYFLQYKHLYSQIELESYKIFSIGCGSLLDYYGFRHSKKDDVSHCYYGIDPYYWCYRDLIPNQNIAIRNKSLADCVKDFKSTGLNKTLGLFNVFIFPKSIEYLENNEKGIHELSLLADVIKETAFKNDKIYLILNGMDYDIEKDEEKLGLIISAFTNSGFVLNSPILRYDGEKCGLNVVCGDNTLQYPTQIQDLLKKICNYCTNRGACPFHNTLKSDPMLSARYFKYRIVELVKEKN